MIECDFCGAVPRVIDNRCLACGLPTLGDWPDEYEKTTVEESTE